MDMLSGNQDLPGIVDSHLGLDNPAFDLPSDFEDIVFKESSSLYLPQDSVTLGVFQNSAFDSSSTKSFTLDHLTRCQSSGTGHGPLTDLQGHQHFNGQGSGQQQLQQRYYGQQQLQQQVYLDSCQPQQGRQQLQPPPAQHEDKAPSCYTISGQSQTAFGVTDSTYSDYTTLPDSPPDSGSEPYSPSDVEMHIQAMIDLRSTIPGSIPTFSPSLRHPSALPAVRSSPGHIPPTLLEATTVNGRHQVLPPYYLQQQHVSQHPRQHTGQRAGQHTGQQMSVPCTADSVIGHQLPGHHLSLSQSMSPAQTGGLPGSMNQANKKRKYSESPTGILKTNFLHGTTGIPNIKQELPGPQCSNYAMQQSCDFSDPPLYDMDTDGAFDTTYQLIKWQPFSESTWAILKDGDLRDLPAPQFRVDADKGFNYSVSDEAFVCQKKNHFQVTVHMCLHGNAKYVRTMEGVMKIESFFLHFYGVKMESQEQIITVEQSQSDRSKRLFQPVRVDLSADQETKVTVGRLHFSETTSNNMRKKGKPNPDQRYFLLVVSLQAQSGQNQHLLAGSMSDQIIVRASNPGQFENDVDAIWQKGQSFESVYHMGRVGVNTDHPEEALTVHGNMRLTGHLTQPSDARAKKDIQEINPKHQLRNVSKLRIYKYTYKQDYAAHVGIPPNSREDTGVLAQEILDVLPDAVQETGDVVLSNGETIQNFLVVNKDRIFMENVGAVKELCKLTDNLETRIDQLEKMNKRLRSLKRFDSLKSTSSTFSGKSASTASNASSIAAKANPSMFTPGKGADQHINNNNNMKNQGKYLRSNNNNNMKNQGKYLRSNKSTSASFLPRHCQQICQDWFRYIVFALILIMALCLVALACLYILEIQKSDTGSSVPSVTESSFRNSSTAETLLSTSVSSSSLSSSLTPTSTTATTILISTTKVTERMSSPSWTNLPAIPPYPVCAPGYCEVLCCPAPHEIEPIINVNQSREDQPHVSVDNNNSVNEGEEIEHPDQGEVVRPQSQETLEPTEHPTMEVMAFRLLGDSSPAADVNYNVDGTMPEKSPKYTVLSPENQSGDVSPNHGYRRRRNAERALKATIQILELNYTVTDDFCYGCVGNNYTYFLPYNSSFSYGDVTLKLSTLNVSYIGLCGSSFMWRCPMSDQYDNEIGGSLQQITNGMWTVKIGNHYRVILNFRVIYSLTGKPVDQNETCSIQNGQDYIVLNYTLKFQRQCD